MRAAPSIRERVARRRTPVLLCCCAILFAGVLAVAFAAPDQPGDDTVGIIDGENIAINGPMNVESVAGQIKTVLRSGSDVRVKSGQAKITLVEGGQISICGPAHLSVLKASGALTIALDSGIIRVRVDQQPAVTIYTPQIEAKPIAVGDDPRELLVGFESPGVMCIRTYRGAMRIEQQLTGQNVMIPQNGDVLLTNGQIDTLRNGEGHCRCELQIAKSAPTPIIPPPSSNGASNANSEADTATAQDETPHQLGSGSTEDTNAPPEKTPPKDDRIYQVTMPPLTYDATAKVQPEPDPRILILVKRVRVRPTLIFQGQVGGPPAPAPTAAAPQPGPSAAVPTATSPTTTPAPKTPPQPQPSFTDRVRSFFHNLWSHNP